jgi:predicted RNase H-like HicB family nuclease
MREAISTAIFYPLFSKTNIAIFLLLVHLPLRAYLVARYLTYAGQLFYHTSPHRAKRSAPWRRPIGLASTPCWPWFIEYNTVEAPALPGCVSEGDTYEEAIANIHEAIEAYLAEPPEEMNVNPRVIVTEVEVAVPTPISPAYA